MNDPIERQAAIGRAVEIPLFGKLVKVVAVSELEALPSAQPDVPDTNDGDMISRQAAIDAICKACANSDDYVECIERRPESTFCDEIVALRKLPSAQRWIPCSERLPKDVQIGEEYPTVIFCTKEKTYTGFYEYYLDGRWWTADGDSVVDGVIAWCELPEPYAERREE